MNENRKNKKDKSEVKEQVVRAAAVFFKQNGIRNVRMDDIAADLSMSKRTIYELFKDKEEVLLEVVKMHREEMLAYMSDVAAHAENVLEVLLKFYEHTVQDMQHTNRRFFEEIEKYPRVQEFIQEGRRQNLDEAMEFYRKGVEQGIFRSEVNYKIVRSMVGEQMGVLLHSEICREYSLAEIYQTVVFMHMRGISTEKGLKIVDDFLAHRSVDQEGQEPW